MSTTISNSTTTSTTSTGIHAGDGGHHLHASKPTPFGFARESVLDLLGVRCFNGEGDGGGGSGSGAAGAASSGGGSSDSGQGHQSGHQSGGQGGGSGGGHDGGQQPGAGSGDQQPGQGSGQGGGGRKFTQADIDKAVQDRLNREKKKQDGQDARVTAAQQEAAAAKAAQQKLLDVIAEATGQKKSDTPPDPAALQQTLTQRENRVSELESQVAERDVLLAAWAAAWEHGADPKRLMDSVSFRGELGQLDRKADGLNTRIADLVKAKVDADESLKAPGQPRTPRPDPSQGSGRPAPTGGERGSAEAQRRFGRSTSKT